MTDAYSDPLTGLVNRRELECRLQEALSTAKTLNQQHVLCYFDLDQFKIVRDTCGRAAGDELLRQLTALLKKSIGLNESLARLGEDKFGLLLRLCSIARGQQIVQQLQETIEQFRFVWQDKRFTISLSIGLVAIDATVESVASALSAADTALDFAKERGRNRIHLYQADDKDLVQWQRDLQWVPGIVKVLDDNRFCLYYQEIAPLQPQASSIPHYEVLLRLNDENGHLVQPMAFIPAAERYNLMPDIDRWVIRTLFASLKQHPMSSQWRFTVNLSGASFNDDRFLDFIQQQLLIYEIPPSMICFEITETLAISNLKKAAQLIRHLKTLGCYFALDDFGTGMSSLAYLQNLPVDYLKIDGQFVKDILDNPINATVVEAVNQIGHAMGLQTIAECVENEAVRQKLQSLGVDYAQGYGIAMPCPLFI